MADHVYKTLELTGTSPESLQKAIENAIARAAETMHNLRWFEVTQVRGAIDGKAIAHWQATMKIGFTLE